MNTGKSAKSYFLLSLLIFAKAAASQTTLNYLTVTNSRHDVSLSLHQTASKETNYMPYKTGRKARTVRKGKAPFSVEQLKMGNQNGISIITSFEGLGYGFEGPQGKTSYRNPSDNSLAVGPNHIMQTVNARMAIFSKKGSLFDSSGVCMYGPVETRNVFRGFGGPCEQLNNGDAVVRYDQLANRWLIMMPTFRRAKLRNDSLLIKRAQPGEPEKLFQPAYNLEEEKRPSQSNTSRPPVTEGSYCMCYAISTGPDPFGPYYRYEFKRELFPDYPRPAIWPDGYYTTTSTGDNVSQRHSYVADRNKMLKGEAATEQCFIINDVNFLVPADLDGQQLPPAGSPAILLATGGDQLKKITTDDGIYIWEHHVDWQDPSKSTLTGPRKIQVAPYDYLGGGQLTKAIPQPGTDMRLDAQGDKLMARVIYRRKGIQESVVAVHSVTTSNGAGGVRWYEFRIGKDRSLHLFQQGTYAPEGHYRWMASPAMDRFGNIGIGYSFGDSTHFVEQRFAARFDKDEKGILTQKEKVLVQGEAAQTNTLRWEDYTQTAMDPSDDWTIWYVGDFLKKNANSYSTKIGAFKIQKKKR